MTTSCILQFKTRTTSESIRLLPRVNSDRQSDILLPGLATTKSESSNMEECESAEQHDTDCSNKVVLRSREFASTLGTRGCGGGNSIIDGPAIIGINRCLSATWEYIRRRRWLSVNFEQRAGCNNISHVARDIHQCQYQQ